MSIVFKAALVSLWFGVLTFPILVLRINQIEESLDFRWNNLIMMVAGTFMLTLVWHWLRDRQAKAKAKTSPRNIAGSAKKLIANKKFRLTFLAVLALFLVSMPYTSSMYQVTIMISALLYIMLGLGLNIVVGLAGQLVLGYAAFYAVGAYTYGLLFFYFDIGFWAALPLGGLMAVLFGIVLGFPVLRLKGDYLAIVTLGFGEIVRLILENWSDVTRGASGIANIPRPGFFGIEMNVMEATNYTYYIVLVAVVITIVVVNRIKYSRVGLALQALREDEIACEAMGIDIARVKLSAFALGSCWAGFAGVIFAAKTTYINPASFTFMESAMILSMVVMGGMGSTLGVTIAACVLILLPEYLRAFSEYRMLIFGAAMVLMMIFRPQGLITDEKRNYKLDELDEPNEFGEPNGCDELDEPNGFDGAQATKGSQARKGSQV